MATVPHLINNVALLINPAAGRGHGGRIGRRVANELRDRGIDVRELVGRDVREAGDLAHEAVEDGADALVVVGGDGMVHLGIQALGGTDVPVGVVPAGTGNDLARAVGIPLNDVTAAANIIAEGHNRRIDLGSSAGQWFAGVVAAGFDAKVNDRANRMRLLRGQRRYDVAVLAELGVFKPISYHLELDEQVIDTDAMLIAVGNIPSYGGGIRITPGAKVDDGQFEVLIVEPVSRATLIRIFPRAKKGLHLSHPAVSARRAKRVKLDAPDVTAYVDGERLGPLPRTFDIVPGALTVLTPPTPLSGLTTP